MTSQRLVYLKKLVLLFRVRLTTNDCYNEANNRDSKSPRSDTDCPRGSLSCAFVALIDSPIHTFHLLVELLNIGSHRLQYIQLGSSHFDLSLGPLIALLNSVSDVV